MTQPRRLALRRSLATLGLAAGVSLGLSACSRAGDQPGAVTADEARQLNDAAAMLDANSVDMNAVTTNESALQ